MFLKALLICDDTRFEMSGTLTLVGVHREIVGGIQMPDGIQFARLVFVAMVGGLAGAPSVQYRFNLRAPTGEQLSREGPIVSEDRDPRTDEHLFLFGNAPLKFPAAGPYEVVLEVRAMREEATYRYAFQVAALAT